MDVGLRVLIVDDNRHTGSLLSSLLRGKGHIAIPLLDAKLVLLKVKELRPDVLFLDVVMPGVDSFEFAKELRGMFSHMRLVALTCPAMKSREDPRIRTNFDAHLEKPVSIFCLEKVLIGLLD